ncbi:uncharacterized protein [Arachis hypogaea]|uniref:uncharacterized protein n=1 Tax=Arachis hypogaea TaxID=3818 RepID=UPI003B228194
MAVITETTIGVIAVQYSRSSLFEIEFWVLHVEFYECGILHQAAALSLELPLLCSLAYLIEFRFLYTEIRVAMVAAVADCAPSKKVFVDMFGFWVRLAKTSEMQGDDSLNIGVGHQARVREDGTSPPMTA